MPLEALGLVGGGAHAPSRDAPARPQPVAAGRVLSLELPLRLGATSNGCVLACGVMVLQHYKVRNVTERSLAEACRVSLPLREGMHLGQLARGLQHYGLRTRHGERLSHELIARAVREGHPIVSGHTVKMREAVGHAVVIGGVVSIDGARQTLIVSDPNIGFRMLVDAETMIASSRDVLVVAGRVS